MARLKEFISFLNGFRKLFICFIVITLATAFLLSGHISGKEFTTVMTITVPSYFAGNIGEHLTTGVKEWLKSRAKK